MHFYKIFLQDWLFSKGAGNCVADDFQPEKT